MRLDFDLIRKLLIYIESQPAGEVLQQVGTDVPYPAAVIGEHIDLLIQAGLIKGIVIDVRAPAFEIHGLTWHGHDFLEKARNDTLWRKVLNEAKEKGLALTIPFLNELLTYAARQVLRP